LQQQISLIERYRGAMIGVHVGDALGAPYETWPEERILADMQARDGLVLFDYEDPWGKDGLFPAGCPTDDSELTAVLAEHLIENPEDLEDLYARFRSCVVDRKSRLCALPAYGFGGTTRRALKEPTYREAVQQPNTRPPIPSNGALMRAVPIPLRFFGSPRQVSDCAYVTSLMTHRHPQAIDASVVYAHLLYGVLEHGNYEQAVARLVGMLPGLTVDQAIIDIFHSPAQKPVFEGKFGGGALHTLCVVHWAVSTSTSFEEGMTKAITIGSDTDTYGAVAGGLLGATYGVRGIPAKWKHGLLGGVRMWQLAEKLHALANPAS